MEGGREGLGEEKRGREGKGVNGKGRGKWTKKMGNSDLVVGGRRPVVEVYPAATIEDSGDRAADNVKLAYDGPHMGLHPGCAQGQGQRSRDTGTSVMSRNVCYTVRSHVLSLHALTL